MSFLLDSDVEEIWSRTPYAAALRGKRVLITGGRGFLGRYFTAFVQKVNQHLSDPVRLTVLDNFISSGDAGKAMLEDDHVRLVEHDCRKPLPVDGPVDLIIHAAGIASPAHYKKYPMETLEVATTGLRHSLDAAKANPGCRMVFFSSSEIYGDPDPKRVPTTEDYRGNVACLGPRACYDESKRLGETMVQIYAQQHGVQASIIRPFNVYGPGMQKTDYRVLPNFAAKIVAGEPVHVYGTGHQTRTFCYVTDAIDGFMRVLMEGAAGEPYNVGNPTPEVSVLELVDEIQGAIGHEVACEVTPYPSTYPADEPNRRCPDITKARGLGYSPQVSLHEGLKRFFRWAEGAYRS